MSAWTTVLALQALRDAGFRHSPGSSALYHPAEVIVYPYLEVTRYPETAGETALDVISRRKRRGAAHGKAA